MKYFLIFICSLLTGCESDNDEEIRNNGFYYQPVLGTELGYTFDVEENIILKGDVIVAGQISNTHDGGLYLQTKSLELNIPATFSVVIEKWKFGDCRYENLGHSVLYPNGVTDKLYEIEAVCEKTRKAVRYRYSRKYGIQAISLMLEGDKNNELLQTYQLAYQIVGFGALD